MFTAVGPTEIICQNSKTTESIKPQAIQSKQTNDWYTGEIKCSGQGRAAELKIQSPMSVPLGPPWVGFWSWRQVHRCRSHPPPSHLICPRCARCRLAGVAALSPLLDLCWIHLLLRQMSFFLSWNGHYLYVTFTVVPNWPWLAGWYWYNALCSVRMW